MKIGIDARLWHETGVGRYIRNLVSQLHNLDKTNEYVLFVKNGFTVKELGFKREDWKIVPTGIHWHSLSEQLQFPQILDKENLDLMHFPYFSHPIFYNKPFVITIHDLIVTHFPTGKATTLPYPLYMLKRFGYDAVIRHGVFASQKIIVPLNSVKDDLVKTFGASSDKIAVTYEGVEKNSKFKIQNSKSQKYFLYVGNAYPHKNLEFLIEAFIDFKKQINTDVKLILVGKADYFYNKLQNKFGKDEFADIVFKHDISDEELFTLYTNALGFISASRMEGFGLPPLEAMSSGCPVLLSDIPSFREVCRDAAFYFDLQQKNSLKEQMILLYNLDHKTIDSHVKKGLERVKEFSWEKMAKETRAIYESCISLR